MLLLTKTPVMSVTATPIVRVTRVHLIGWLLAVTILAPRAPAQQQTPNARAGWPCGGRLDPSYFATAEGSGGHLLLLAPEELADSAALLTAFGDHPQTIFRLAGTMNPGLHEFRVPIDSIVESVLFSVSVQCLQIAEVLRPSGTPAGGADTTDLSNFRAERMVVVKRPDPGVWTVRAAGSGIAGVMVQARSGLGIADVQFAAADSTDFRRTPLAGVENLVRIDLNGSASHVEASLVDAAFHTIAPLPLTAGDRAHRYLSRFTAGAAAFRVLVEGQDASAAAFQRLHAPLFSAR